MLLTKKDMKPYLLWQLNFNPFCGKNRPKNCLDNKNRHTHTIPATQN